MELDFIRERITQLRLLKDVSEYQMSRDLGHAKNYIQKIVSGQSLPSLPEFLYICEYLGVEPREFFSNEIENPALLQKALDKIRALPDEDLEMLLQIIEWVRKKL